MKVLDEIHVHSLTENASKKCELDALSLITSFLSHLL